MFKQLDIPTYFLTLSCFINKLRNLKLSYEEIRNLNNKSVIAARLFMYKVVAFFKDIILDGPLEKTKYYAIRRSFQKWVAHMSICLYGLSMHEIFMNFFTKTKAKGNLSGCLLTLIFDRKEVNYYFLRKKIVNYKKIPNIFKETNIDCFMERPGATFCNGKLL